MPYIVLVVIVAIVIKVVMTKGSQYIRSDSCGSIGTGLFDGMGAQEKCSTDENNLGQVVDHLNGQDVASYTSINSILDDRLSISQLQGLRKLPESEIKDLISRSALSYLGSNHFKAEIDNASRMVTSAIKTG